MPETTRNDEPRDLAGMGVRFVPINSIEVAEWHPESGGRGKPEQVHLLIEVKGMEDVRLVLRMKTGAAVDAIADALAEHRRNVFGPR